ncbi:proline racemase family protein [Paenibacillus sp. PL91]|uniref:proline racemase family protein n=1 Tax=Paenibacillus sp. PL91 TaxID=2729538 RepID=UPI00145F0661|nr:proline racemase family protein [Paenibacillus sp. PL91]MBC9203712.1 proline racemase family protein [Paenibacillus sp. PL91]
MEINKWFAAIDTHSGGEPLRVITGGLPQMEGATQQARADYFIRNFDSVRRVLMAEPRGHHGMTGAIVTTPASEDAHFGLLFMNNEGLAPVSGHGVIAAVTAWIETGQLLPDEADQGIRIDCPAGRITAYTDCEGSEVKSVSFDNVPSFVYELDVPISLQGLEFTVDVAFSGAFYAIVDAKALGGIKLTESALPDLQAWGGEIRRAVESQLTVVHPKLADITGIHGVVICDADDVHQHGSDYRNVTVFAGEQFDRSPGGAGACAHMAVLMRRGELRLGKEVVYEGIAGSQAIGRTMEELTFGSYKAILPRLTGNAYILGLMNFVVDPSDPLSDGFVLR